MPLIFEKCTYCRGTGTVGEYTDSGPEPCPRCNGTGEIKNAENIEGFLTESAPTLADVIALLERQAKTCERIAITLKEIEFTVRSIK